MTHDGRQLECLLEKIHSEWGFDFRGYKETTLTRRLGRRLRARGAETYSDYACVLDRDPAEYGKLFNDLTINVTSFFRDEVAFKALAEQVLPALIGEHGKAASTCRCLQIWSAGCATGQEPYSIAMLLLEMLHPEVETRHAVSLRCNVTIRAPEVETRHAVSLRCNVTIRATDIDAKALQRAQEGVFTAKDVEGIRPAWLGRYFVPDGDGFRVQPVLRQLVTFEAHNLVSDAPYHDLDLVVCRNVLIYFAPALQTRVLRSFHEGLKEGGFLLLGKAEVPAGETERLFHRIDKKAKLYQKM